MSREAPKLTGSLRAAAVPGEKGVAMQLAAPAIATEPCLALCFPSWIQAPAAQHKAGVRRGRKGTVL